MRTVQEVQRLFNVLPDTGLAPDAVEKSRAQFGSNRLTPLPREPLWKKFLGKFDEPIIKILLAAALLSMFVDLFNTAAVTAAVALFVVLGGVGFLSVRGLGQWVPAALF